MINVQHLTKDYGEIEALKGITFSVKQGSFFALLGPNGAGKTTTVRILSTLLSKTSGEVHIHGKRLTENDARIRRMIGIVFQQSTLDDMLSVKENLLLRGQFYGLRKATVLKRIDTLSEWMDFKDTLNQRVKTLSGGQRRKIDVARALINEPKILILDEPTTGLDPLTRRQLWTVMTRVRKETNMTVLLTTHYMEEVHDADHVVIIDRGEIIAEDSAHHLRLKHAKNMLYVTPKDVSTIETLSKALGGTSVEGRIHVPLNHPFDALKILSENRDTIESFEVVEGSMDDVFLNLTGRRFIP